MVNRFFSVATLLLLLLLVGCASPTKMAFYDDSETITNSSNPVYLMTATLKNSYKTSHQPKLLVVNVEKEIVTGREDRLNFTMDDKAKNESSDPDMGNHYFLRMALEPGNFVIRGLTSQSSSFPINGFFFAPIHENIEVSDGGVYYLGHISATVREREGDEFKAGPSIPLIDQAVVGASGGTFDIEITDQWAKDEAAFRRKFPALATVDVKKVILPSFDRNRAQKWWEDN